MALTNQKQSPIPVVPRQMQIVNADGTPTRSGQLLLQQLSNSLVSYGAAGDLANATDVQDGQIFIVQGDNDEVLYQYQGGDWHYVSGTMWGTLSPDERPVGLGPNDAGFTFRTIDSDPQYSARTFVWSGTIWVETTAARFGTHAARLNAYAGSTMNGTVWVETDRSEVVYQLQGSAWHFCAGTMWGTMSPDQRPTDLGANDAGFQYRSTDPPPRSFIWSGTVWVETSPPAQIPQTPWTSNINAAGYSLGNVGSIAVGVASTAETVEIQAATPILRLSTSTAGVYYDISRNVSDGVLEFNAGQAGYSGYRFKIQGTQVAVLTTAGNLLIGAGTPGYQLQLTTDSAAKPTTNTWVIASDLRLKQNVQPLEGGLEVINQLQPIVAEYNGKAGTPADGRVVSLDPAKLREILPHAVSSIRGKLDPADAEETDILGVNTHEILYHLVLAVQQLSKKT